MTSEIEGRLELAEGAIERLAAAHRQGHEADHALARRIADLEAWAENPGQPLAAARSRLAELEARFQRERQEIVADLAALIRADPQLRELLRGPRGLAGLDGKPGPPGDSAATVIREVKISG